MPFYGFQVNLHIIMAPIQLHHIHHRRVVILYPNITHVPLILVEYRIKYQLHLSNWHVNTAQTSPGCAQVYKLVKPIRVAS